MKVREYLLHHTNVGDVCIITNHGYDVIYAVIDHEDLFIGYMDDDWLNKKVLEVKEEYRPWAKNKVRVIDVEW